MSRYLNEIMKMELAEFLGRKPYERKKGGSNHRNGSYPRSFTMKRIEQVDLKVPRDREGRFQTQVIPRSRQMEDELCEDVCLISTRTLSMISSQLIARRISPSQVSLVSKELIDVVEQ